MSKSKSGADNGRECNCILAYLSFSQNLVMICCTQKCPHSKKLNEFLSRLTRLGSLDRWESIAAEFPTWSTKKNNIIIASTEEMGKGSYLQMRSHRREFEKISRWELERILSHPLGFPAG